MPTEAEWEYVALAGTLAECSPADTKKQTEEKYFFYLGNALDAGDKDADPVRRKGPNPWGLYNMHGNVWEWVQDWYDKNYYRSSPETDPQGASSGRSRVVRGGSWYFVAKGRHSAVRYCELPQNRVYNLGFRLLRILNG